jgi:regulator of replication initiation timing
MTRIQQTVQEIVVRKTELAMENEFLRERIRRMEDEKLFLRWRSKR